MCPKTSKTEVHLRSEIAMYDEQLDKVSSKPRASKVPQFQRIIEAFASAYSRSEKSCGPTTNAENCAVPRDESIFIFQPKFAYFVFVFKEALRLIPLVLEDLGRRNASGTWVSCAAASKPRFSVSERRRGSYAVLLSSGTHFETMVYKRLVQIGRVVFIAKGKDAGKIATVVDVVDGNRVLIDGPSTGVSRCVRNLKDLQLTKFVVKVRVGQRTKKVKEAFESAKIAQQFKETSWAKKIAQKAVRAKLTDYDRFKLMKARQMRNRLVRIELAKLKKSAK